MLTPGLVEDGECSALGFKVDPPFLSTNKRDKLQFFSPLHQLYPRDTTTPPFKERLALKTMNEDPLATLRGSGSGSAPISSGEVNLSSVCEDENVEEDSGEDENERLSPLPTVSNYFS
jgi:hypothetical protein